MTVESTRNPFEMNRRGFLRTAGAAAGLAAFGGFSALGARGVSAAGKKPFSGDYGPIHPVRDEATGLELLMLPQGFRYISYSWEGDAMSNGDPAPGAHDGMAAFMVDKNVHLVRNHEINDFDGSFTTPAYDPSASGGTTNLVFDPKAGKWLSVVPSLSGTIRNCAGGPTPWGSWLTCEETLAVNGTTGVKHGYVFEVPVLGQATAIPLKAMGRMAHEAIAIDPDTGYVYLTEDEDPAGFFRFRPNQAGNLAAGGVLEMLAINASSGQTYDAREDATGTQYSDIGWVRIDNPDPDDGQPTPTEQGLAKGGAWFTSLEGVTYSDGALYIISSGGGPLGQGTVYEYRPSANSLRVLYSSPAEEILNNPDNITASPRPHGGLVLCEDGDGVEYLHGLTRDGEIFRFCANNIVIPDSGVPGKPQVDPDDYTGEEFAGATFEPKHGDWLFVNIQTPGITFAITGPWNKGAL